MARLAVLTAIALAPTAAHAQFVIDYETSTFCNNQGSINLVSGSYFIGAGVCGLMVADPNEYEAAAWYTTAFDPSQYERIETRFVLDISGGDLGSNGWDGMTFALQGVGTAALGDYLGLSYEGISPSWAVEFDTWDTGGISDPNNNHIGIDQDGVMTSLITATAPMDLNSNTLAYVWVDFDIAAQTMDVYVDSVNLKPVAPLLTRSSVDLTALGSTVYAGFTAASGSFWTGYAWRTGNNHTVSSWYLEAFDVDSDGDGVPNDADACPGFDDNLDADTDTIPDGCDICPGFDDRIDADGDGVPAGCDPCPADLNDDSDGDGSCDSADLCPGFDDTLDSDGDGVPTGCDPCPQDLLDDSDSDGSCDSADLCPGFDDSVDPDGDGVPTGCDPCPLDLLDDSDGDGSCDSADTCPGVDDYTDGDGDGLPDCTDPCPIDNPNDTDGDTVCDSADQCPGADDLLDTDGDTIPNCLDLCPNDALDDSDGDGSCDSVDLCPGANDLLDTDGDGTPDCLDLCPTDPTGDSDGDGVCNIDDICPGFDDNDDYDGDGIPNGCDSCVGVPVDADGDGVPDPCDVCQGYDDYTDSDGDGVPDGCDLCPSNPFNGDADGDGFISCFDCDDANGSVFPGALGEAVADGVDQDCDGAELCYEDLDGDGYGSQVTVLLDGLDCSQIAGGSDNDLDCDDANLDANPGAAEIAFNGIDDDCDGAVDEDDPTTGTGTGTGGSATGTGTGATTDGRDYDPDEPGVDGGEVKAAAVGCGCDSSGGSAPWALLLVGLAGLRRRRRGCCPSPSSFLCKPEARADARSAAALRVACDKLAATFDPTRNQVGVTSAVFRVSTSQ